jgi:hypothetical protein
MNDTREVLEVGILLCEINGLLSFKFFKFFLPLIFKYFLTVIFQIIFGSYFSNIF